MKNLAPTKLTADSDELLAQLIRNEVEKEVKKIQESMEKKIQEWSCESRRDNWRIAILFFLLATIQNLLMFIATLWLIIVNKP